MKTSIAIITLNPASEEVQELVSLLASQGLTGTLPTEFTVLPLLEEFSVPDNDMAGEIPAFVGLYESLQVFNVSGNRLRGRLWERLFTLSEAPLRIFDVSNNDLSGTIPSEIWFKSGTLEQLILSNNFFTGSLPTDIANLSLLEVLNASGNQLTGTIPSELAFLGTLDSIRLDSNDLGGTIPTEVALNSNLRVIRLDDNTLIGTIPSEMGRLIFLRKS